MKKEQKARKILFLSRLYKPNIGGVETHIEKISHLLVNEGFRVSVVCEQHDKDLEISKKIDGIDVIRIPITRFERKKKFVIWKWMINNINLFKSFDIIHIHDVFYWIIPLLPFLDKSKIFVTFHGYEKYPVSFQSKIQKKIAAKFSAGNISVGNFVSKWFGIGSNAVINGGVEDGSITAKSSKKEKKVVNILYIGRLSDDMGVKIYLDVLKKLKKNNFKFTFEACGDGEYRKDFEKFGKVNGFVKDISLYIKKSDIVFSSSYLSMLEASIQRKPIFAVYDNPLKEDYLRLSPFSKFVSISSDADRLFESISKDTEEINIEYGYSWAKKQSWENVLKVYERLWKL